ncbi:alpha/beta hydrolase [Craterilacuibacter sp. RT1T]|uniref:alpha/beta hydrolase n=1 Tax=Craterilacuibacter sp. RT1T TaxID=2942211 RepID=UPI0020BF4FCD|nr:alpha/beta hydrolase [Craterilacuibacter sp. RT1T]MCL6262873.1 alpha/beta hydrolase [Craterilacuibacter sp. RT1T]
MPAKLELLRSPASGAPKGPPLLFVHGAFSGAWCWQRHFMPWFNAQGYDCLALSLEGHAASEGQPYLAAISIQDYVDNLSRTIAALERAPVVIAHSMGGFVLQQYLTRHTLPGAAFLASVSPLGLTGSALNMLTYTPELLLALNRYQASPGPMADRFMAEIRALLFSDAASEEDVALLAQRSQQESQRAIMDMTLINPLWQRRLNGTPALVLGAGQDKIITPADIAASAARLGVNAEILPELAHMMMLDAGWESAAQRIARWLSTLAA